MGDVELKMLVKENPAQVIGLAECDARLEAFLQEPVADTVEAEAVEANQRRPFEYLTLRGQRAKALLLGVRGNSGSSLEISNYARLPHGTYETAAQGTFRARSEVMVGKVRTDNNIGWIGQEHTVLVVHLHKHFANHAWPRSVPDFWEEFSDFVRERSPDILMGDFGTLVLEVAPELRSRGVTVDLAAWFPFKAVDGTPCAGTQAIFFVGLPGLYKLKKGLADLHARDPTGILWSGCGGGDVAVAADGDTDTGFNVIQLGVCGYPLASFPLGILGSLQGSLEATLTPSMAKEEMQVKSEEKKLFKVVEKRLKFLKEALEALGHYPVCAFTDNKSIRSGKAQKCRWQRWEQLLSERKKQKGKGGGSKSGGNP
jgi:hypothetical protein